MLAAAFALYPVKLLVGAALALPVAIPSVLLGDLATRAGLARTERRWMRRGSGG